MTTPERAWKRLEEILGHVPLRTHHINHKFAAYIAEKEEPPVDPLLEEAREICARLYERESSKTLAKGYREGKYDHELESAASALCIALAALKRGIEIGRGE